MDSKIFDMHELWKDILTNSKEPDNPSLEEFPTYLEKIYPAEPKLEDFDFYKEYLSQFVLNEELYGKEFLNDCDLSHDECILLLRLAAASFSSTYEVAYLKDEDKLELTIHVTSGEQSVTKKLQELWSFQIYSLYKIYLEEQLHLEFLLAKGEDGVEYERGIAGERKQRLSIFEKEMIRCTDELHGIAGGRNSARIIEDKLDELLKS